MKLGWSLIAAALVASAAMAEDAHFKKTAQPATNLVIRGYWRADKNCEAKEPPMLLFDKPPEHGIVCFRRDEVTMYNVVVGDGLQHCLGRRIRGLKLIYQPRLGYSGPDEVRYTVVFPRVRHSVSVDLTVLPSRFHSKDDLTAPVEGPLQSPGPVPECAPLVS
jgi:hypothetical protein